MFLLLFLALMVTGFVHAWLRGRRSRRGLTELMLVHVLVAYFGVLMLAMVAYGVVDPEGFAAAHGWKTTRDNPFQAFTGVALGSMAVAALLSFRLRGLYLVGPATCWSLFFLGATWAHVQDYAGRGREVDLDLVLHVFTSHGLVSVLLLALLAVHYWPSRTKPEPR